MTPTTTTTTMSRLLATLAATALVITGCSSSGGGSNAPDTATLTAKLKQDPEIKQLESSVGAASSKVQKVISCIATALQKDANPDDLNKYVAGKIGLSDVSGRAGVSAKKAEQDTENCAKNALGVS
jgi:PBP1b-binding outer membrane lipoprotein LpoB